MFEAIYMVMAVMMLLVIGITLVGIACMIALRLVHDRKAGFRCCVISAAVVLGGYLGWRIMRDILRDRPE